MSVEACSLPIVKHTDLDFRSEFYRRHFAELASRGIDNSQATEIIYGTIYGDLTKAFLERFTKERLVHFSYRFEGDRLVSPGYGHFGDITERYNEAIRERIREGLPFHREKAECEGLRDLKIKLKESDSELNGSKRPKTFLLISPPPPPEELHLYSGRYGEDSFYFFGKYDPVTEVVDMFAWRNKKTFDDEVREADQLSETDHEEFVHPNDLLKKPFIRERKSFDWLRKVIPDIPADWESEMVKNENYSKYRKGIDCHSRMLTTLVASGASDEVLLDAQLRIEMDFTRWIIDGVVEESKIKPIYLHPNYHREFSNEVRADFVRFVAMYGDKIDKFACGSCGLSVMRFYMSSLRIFEPPLLLTVSMPELFSPARSCPNCGENLALGSRKCENCRMTKDEYDAKQMKAA